MLLAIHLVMIMVFVILGVIFLNGKGAFLIAGYNTTSKAEKQKTDEKKLCSFMGKNDVYIGRVLARHCFQRDFQSDVVALGRSLSVFCRMCRCGHLYEFRKPIQTITSSLTNRR